MIESVRQYDVRDHMGPCYVSSLIIYADVFAATQSIKRHFGEWDIPTLIPTFSTELKE